MEEDELENNFLVNNYNYNYNFKDDMKNSQTFKSEYDNEEKAPDYNEITEDIFQYSTNTNNKESPLKISTKHPNFNCEQNNSPKNNNYNFDYNNNINNNSFLDSPQKQINENLNLNEDISGISLLKELEDQWNNIEKQKINYNKNKDKDNESTFSNSKINNAHERFKYIKDMVECKKKKFLSMRQKARSLRNNDHEIEQFFLTKFKDMEKYKIMDKKLKEKIEIRQQEKLYEEQMKQKDNNGNNYNINQNENVNMDSINDNNNGYENENDNDMNYYNENDNNEYYENENNQQEIKEDPERKRNNINKKIFLGNDDDEINYNYNQMNNNQKENNFENNENPELEDLIYETPARTLNNFNTNQILEQIKNKYNYNNYNHNDEEQNEDNYNLKNSNSNKLENCNISGNLMEKMKSLFEEIKGQKLADNKNESKIKYKNNLYNKVKDKDNSFESGVLGINNINIINNNYTDNNILMNIKNPNPNNQNNIRTDNKMNINDANKSINLNFNYDNNISNINNINSMKYYNKQQNQNKSFIENDINNINNSSGLFSLEQNFDDIMKQIKSSFNSNKANKNKKLDLFEDKDKKENNYELDKYFEDLSKEAKLRVKEGKIVQNKINVNKNKDEIRENKIKKKIRENSDILNQFVNEMNSNKNKFKQRMMAINNNLNNLKIKEGNNNNYKMSNNYGIMNSNKYQKNTDIFNLS